MSRIRKMVATTTVAAVGVTVLGVTPAQAGGREEIREGHCSGRSDWKLKVKTDNGRLEVEGEVDSNVNGQTWQWRILHDGGVSARGTATTSGPSGSFDVTRRLVNTSGDDRIGWRARNPNSGETCRGALTF